MTNTIFEVFVRSFDKDYNRTRTIHRIYGESKAMQFGMEIGICENVECVNVCDALTGEIVLTMDGGELTYMAK